jgi:hypothetical protein
MRCSMTGRSSNPYGLVSIFDCRTHFGGCFPCRRYAGARQDAGRDRERSARPANTCPRTVAPTRPASHHTGPAADLDIRAQPCTLGRVVPGWMAYIQAHLCHRAVRASWCPVGAVAPQPARWRISIGDTGRRTCHHRRHARDRYPRCRQAVLTHAAETQSNAKWSLFCSIRK